MSAGTTIDSLMALVEHTYEVTHGFCHAEDCPNEGKRVKLYSCKDCEFTGCIDCQDSHESEGHSSDSDTSREMQAGLRGGSCL